MTTTEAAEVRDLAERLWNVEFLARSRPPRPLPADSLFVAAIALVAANRVELALALSGLTAD